MLVSQEEYMGSYGNVLDLVDFFNGIWNNFPVFVEADMRGTYNVPSFPPVDVSINKDNKNMVFDFAVAGYTEEELDINFSGDYLILKLESKAEDATKTSSVKVIHKGIRKQDVNFKYYVPSDKYLQDNVEATLANGILTVKIPAREEAQKKKITIIK